MRHVPFGELRPLPPLVLAVLGGGGGAATTTATALAATALAIAVAPAALLVLVAVAPFVAASGAFWLFAASTKGGDGGKQHQVKSMYPLTQQLKMTDLCFTENPGLMPWQGTNRETGAICACARDSRACARACARAASRAAPRASRFSCCSSYAPCAPFAPRARASRAPQASSAANDALLAEFPGKNCARRTHLRLSSLASTSLQAAGRAGGPLACPAGHGISWRAAGGFFWGAPQGLFLPKARRTKHPGPVFEWQGRDGAQRPIRLH